MPIYFYSPHDDPYGCFSNFSPHGVDLDGEWWPTVEHYFQAQKFAGTPHVQVILAAGTPKRAKELGWSRQYPLRADWEAVKDEAMRRAVRRKFELHPKIREVLLATGEEALVENAPSDYYWGCGKDGSGLNRLGENLMAVRAELRRQE